MLGECELLLLLCCFAGAVGVPHAVQELGREKEDCDVFGEISAHDNETEPEKLVEDERLTREAVLDVAYYLRRFKFSGFDPRYLAEGELPRQNLFAEFPSPPLRSIHWEMTPASGADRTTTTHGFQASLEKIFSRRAFVPRRTPTYTGFKVKKNCEPSFLECVKYLQEQVSQAVLPRHLDSLTITKQNGWSFITDRNLIKSADSECLRLLESDENALGSFSGPVQRFQWLASASYYMCFYTMREIKYLKNFLEDCDNHASCIQWDVGPNNKDVRGDNSRPFACAAYSFCPDPCCPLKHLPDWSACDKENPCIDELSPNKTCSFSRSENSHFESLILNRWNISCTCEQPGTRWQSKSGMCIDVDECVELKSPCNFPAETCRNLPGTYKCACSALGYRRNSATGACERDPILHPVFFKPQTVANDYAESFANKICDNLRRFYEKLRSIVAMSFAAGMPESNRTDPF